MTNQEPSRLRRPDMEPAQPPSDDVEGQWRRVVRRRAFLKVGAGVAAATIPAGGLLATNAMAAGGTLTRGDAAAV